MSRALADAGIPLRLLVRTPSKAPSLPGSSVETFDYSDRNGCETALSGVQTLFFVSAAENEHRLAQHRNVVEAAAAAGVHHVVYTSFVGASPTCTFTLGRDHFATEQLIRDAGMTHTFLRDNFYQDLLPYFVGDDGIVRGPAGDGRAAFVARVDIARVAAVVLSNPEAHADRTYDLTGPEALTLDEVATVLTAGPAPVGLLRRRDGAAGLRVPRPLRRPGLAAGRLGLDLHGDPGRRARAGQR